LNITQLFNTNFYERCALFKFNDQLFTQTILNIHIRLTGSTARDQLTSKKETMVFLGESGSEEGRQEGGREGRRAGKEGRREGERAV
jgi:hypothetical protein